MKNNFEKKNFFWNFLGLTANSFNSFFFLIIVNRLNGSYEAGIFTYAYSLICLFYMIGIFYTRTYQISDFSDQYNNREYVIGRFISCFLMLLVTIAFVKIFNYDLFKSSIIILICIYRLLEALSDVFLGILQKNGFLYKSGFSLFIKAVIGLFFFFITDFIWHSLFISCLSIVMINLIFLLLYDIPNSRMFIEKQGILQNALKILKNSVPVFVFSFLNIYLVNSAKYTLDYFDTAEIQNIFGIILMPGTILSLCSQYILNPYLLQLTNYYQHKLFDKFNHLILKILRYIVFFGVFCEIIAYFFGIPLLNFVYGIDLTNYHYHLLIIILGSIFVALIAIISSVLTIMKKNHWQMYIYIIDSILSFIVSILLIKQYSIMGATLTYTIIMVLQFVNFYIIYRYYLVKEGEIRNERKN